MIYMIRFSTCKALDRQCLGLQTNMAGAGKKEKYRNTYPPSIAEFKPGRCEWSVCLTAEVAGQSAVAVHHCGSISLALSGLFW